jgi:hypothetical protein
VRSSKITIGDPETREVLKARFPQLAHALSTREWNALWDLMHRGDFTDQGLLDLTADLLAHNIFQMLEHQHRQVVDLGTDFGHAARVEQFLQRVVQAINVKAPEKRKTAAVVKFPNRAAWLQSVMDKRKLKPYRIHKAGGPDYKTIRRILNGQHVNDEPLERLRLALAFITNTAAEKIVIPTD